MLDLMHLYDKFYGELPDSLLRFKSDLNALYPCIFDNRELMFQNKEVQQTLAAYQGGGLERAYQRVMKQDFSFDQKI